MIVVFPDHTRLQFLSTRKSDNSPRPSGLSELSLFRVYEPQCLPKLKTITVLLCDFSTKIENILLSLLLLKPCST